jgi:hypothetical protein
MFYLWNPSFLLTLFLLSSSLPLFIPETSELLFYSLQANCSGIKWQYLPSGSSQFKVGAHTVQSINHKSLKEGSRGGLALWEPRIRGSSQLGVLVQTNYIRVGEVQPSPGRITEHGHFVVTSSFVLFLGLLFFWLLWQVYSHSPHSTMNFHRALIICHALCEELRIQRGPRRPSSLWSLLSEHIKVNTFCLCSSLERAVCSFLYVCFKQENSFDFAWVCICIYRESTHLSQFM